MTIDTAAPYLSLSVIRFISNSLYLRRLGEQDRPPDVTFINC